MAELTDAQRQMLVLALSGQHMIPGASQILPPIMQGGLPPAVVNAIRPNLGINAGKQGDFLTGVMPQISLNPDPRMGVRPLVPPADRSLEIGGSLAPSAPLLRRI